MVVDTRFDNFADDLSEAIAAARVEAGEDANEKSDYEEHNTHWGL